MSSSHWTFCVTSATFDVWFLKSVVDSSGSLPARSRARTWRKNQARKRAPTASKEVEHAHDLEVDEFDEPGKGLAGHSCPGELDNQVVHRTHNPRLVVHAGSSVRKVAQGPEKAQRGPHPQRVNPLPSFSSARWDAPCRMAEPSRVQQRSGEQFLLFG